MQRVCHCYVVVPTSVPPTVPPPDDRDDALPRHSSTKLSGSLDYAPSVTGGGSSSASVAGGGGGGADMSGAGAGTSGSGTDTRVTTLFAAAISPDYSITGGKLRRIAAAAGPTPGASPAAGQPPTSAASSPFAAATVCLAFHPTLPLLAGADGSGRIVVWRIGLADGVHATVASRDSAMPPAPDGSLRTVTALLLHPVLPRLLVSGYAPDALR
jgi:hypothetical protein